ncbi:hypothetical protein KHA96_17320 [Bacillus sp. FJAT-49711]|uniref:hypothetical protein n=1 Tax=Bacillus sp. FJAT-49711 TaxID=2833585 RepID=UPI001BCA402B|nr:hypothetical protein [Bacillus sp. FJAT-49711]MBS4220075.1 hypothetical protein [Bacillus sp. FJAT-49711]
MNGRGSNFPILHIYPQKYHHDEAIIIGRREGLERMKATIEKALETGEGNCTAVTSDIESYKLHIFINDEAPNSDFWRTLNLPYVDFVDDGIILGGDDYLIYEIKNSKDLRETCSVIEEDRKRSKIMQGKIMEVIERNREKNRESENERRDQERIKTILNLIFDIWQQHSDMRFFQLLEMVKYQYSSKNNDIGKRTDIGKDEGGIEQPLLFVDLFNVKIEEFESFLKGFLQQE